MERSKIFGFVIMAVGIFLLAMAYHATSAPLEDLSHTMTGRYSSETTWYFAAGIAAVVGGLLLSLFGRRS